MGAPSALAAAGQDVEVSSEPALLASLHEIAPKCCRWEPRTLGALIDEAALKDAYKLSLIAVHPDKLGGDATAEALELATAAFQTLAEAHARDLQAAQVS